MKKIILLLLVFFLKGFYLSGCTMTHVSFEPEEKQALFTLTGGSVGALIAGNLGGFIVGTFIADIGSLTLIEYNGKQVKSREDALKKYTYNGEKVKLFIEGSSATIKNVKNGSTVEAIVQYTLLAPLDTQKINITERRILTIANKSLELDTREIVRTQGTYISTIKFKMPKDIPKGYYTLLTTISDGRDAKAVKSVMKII